MKSGYKAVLAVILLGAGIATGTALNNPASGAPGGKQPGTADDPVVTKSYVDQQIAQALGGNMSVGSSSVSGTKKGTTSSTNATATTNATAATNTIVPSVSAPTDPALASNSEVKVVELAPGKKLIAKAGAEFIVRNGKASVYSMDTSGVIDITNGTEIFHNQAVEKNHLLSFPREGRGIQVQKGQTNTVTVMVRGGYSIS